MRAATQKMMIDRNPGLIYSRIFCSRGPVAWIDRVSLRVDEEEFPLLRFPPLVFHPLRKKGSYHFGLRKDLRPDGFYVKRGWVGKKRYVWIDCYRVPLNDSINSAYVDALLRLSDVGVMDLGKDVLGRRGRAEEVLSHFRPVGVEVRVDLSGTMEKSLGKTLRALQGEGPLQHSSPVRSSAVGPGLLPERVRQASELAGCARASRGDDPLVPLTPRRSTLGNRRTSPPLHAPSPRCPYPPRLYPMHVRRARHIEFGVFFRAIRKRNVGVE